jgi:hypothetical protein
VSIYDRVLSFIYKPDPARFEQLALEVFHYQFDTVAPYRRFCSEKNFNLALMRAIDEIPVTSNVAFKYANLSTNEIPDRALQFLTSGTTKGRERRGRHVVPIPQIYRASAIEHLRTMLYPDRLTTAMLALHPTSRLMPESSLATMITWCIEEFGTESRMIAASREGIDVDAALDFLIQCVRSGEAVTILGTTAAFAAIYAELRSRGVRLELPRGSRMMDTGGAKGQPVPMRPDETIALGNEMLGIAPEMIINEYGMTELCSQLYDATALNSHSVPAGDRMKVAPQWMRVTARDPLTMNIQPDGEPGLLAFFDLANVGSVSAIVTEDIGVIEHGAVRVIGRASIGAARGCALSIDQFARAAEFGSVRRTDPNEY